jgi:regulator of sigma E protease
MSILTSLPLIVVGLFVLSVVVFIHELGHFLLAKWNNIGVLEFSVGFGRKIWQRKFGETFYSIGLIPLGGYVRMLGDDLRNREEGAPTSDPVALENERQLDESMLYGLPLNKLDPAFLNDRSRWLLNKGYWAKMSVVAAGPLFNIASAILISWFVVYFYGVPVPSDEPKIGSVVKESPAEQAGIKPGDRVVTANGLVMNSWIELAEYLTKNSKDGVQLVIERKVKQGVEAEKVELTVTGKLEEVERALVRGEESSSRYLIGVGPSIGERTYIGLGKSLVLGTASVYGVTVMMVKSLGWMIRGKVGTESVSGPIAIVGELGKAAERGLEPLLSFVVLISVCLAVMNLLPIPVLDGGHLVFFTIEKILGKPIHFRVQELATQVGLFLLMGLMVFAIGNDIFKLIRPALP